MQEEFSVAMFAPSVKKKNELGIGQRSLLTRSMNAMNPSMRIEVFIIGAVAFSVLVYLSHMFNRLVFG